FLHRFAFGDSIMTRIASLVVAMLMLTVSVALPGCSTRKDSAFYPSAQTAHNAVEAALTAWQQGNAPGSAETSPRVQVTDSGWAARQKLVGFTILREETEVDQPPMVVVQLTVQGKQPTEVRYKVVGLAEPLLVIREGEDDSRAGM